MASSACGAHEPVPRADGPDAAEHANARALAFLQLARSKAATLVRDTAHEPCVQVTVASAASGAVMLGASGGATGFVTGGIVGAVLGVIAAPVTLGLSVPVGTAVGSAAGLGCGTAVGVTTGFWGGGATGYGLFRAYSKRRTEGREALEDV